MGDIVELLVDLAIPNKGSPAWQWIVRALIALSVVAIAVKFLL